MLSISCLLTLPLVLLFSCVHKLDADDRQKPNVLLICVDDLRPELNCFGASYIHSPNIDALAKTGTIFDRHYVQAPTCGASRYALLTGRYGESGNGALMKRAARIAAGKETPVSLPGWFQNQGYTTVAVGKVSHFPGGCAGKNWDDKSKLEMPKSWQRQHLPAGQWKHPRGWMHGLANGEIRQSAKDMDVFQAAAGDDSIYPDGLATKTAIEEIEKMSASKKPIFLAVGLLKPHLPFGAPKRYLDLYQDKKLPPIRSPEKPNGKTTWHGSGEFMKYHRWNRNPNVDAEFATEIRKHYAACVSYADAQVGKIIAALKKSGEYDRTVIVLWGDHGWHLGEHAVWGKHTLFEESLRAPLIIAAPGTKHVSSSSAVVETIDIFPTLCQLAGAKIPDSCHGVSIAKNLTDKNAKGHPAVSYHTKAQTVRDERYRLIQHRNDETELYDHASKEKEAKSIDNPQELKRLKKILADRLSQANR